MADEGDKASESVKASWVAKLSTPPSEAKDEEGSSGAVRIDGF